MSENMTENMTVRECRSLLIGQYTNITGRIQLRPWDETNYTTFEDLHVNVSLVLQDRGQRGGVETKKIPLLDSINGVFKAEVDGRLPARILVLGPAGHGKTTMIAKMAYDWANNDEKSPLKDVPLLFALKVRQANQRLSLGEEILAQLLGHCRNATAEDIERFISEHEEQCVILLDGYDERGAMVWTSGIPHSLVQLLRFERFKKTRVLITSRPHRKGDFASGNLNYVYATMEIEGFKDVDRKEYLSRFFISNPAEKANILEYLSRHYVISSLLKIPLFCMAICILWQAGLLENVHPLTNIFENLLKYFIQHAQSKLCCSGMSVIYNISPRDVKSNMCDIGQVALHKILSKTNNTIEEEDFNHCPDSLKFGIKIGLISKKFLTQDSSKWYENAKTHLEFYHHLAEEHCAGLYLANCPRQRLEEFLKKRSEGRRQN